MNPSKYVKQAETFIADHLVECCTELHEWDETGILRNGRVREAAAMYAHITTHGSLNIARSEVERQAVAFIAKTKGSK